MSDEREGGNPDKQFSGRSESDGTEGLVFRYSRAHRLERAPESVRWLSSRRGAKRPGILRSLVATRASRLLLFTILGLVVAFYLVPFISKSPSSGKLRGDGYSVKAFWFEDRVFVSLTRSGPILAEAERRTLSLRARAGRDESLPVVEAVFVAGLAESEDFRLALAAGGAKPSEVAVGITVEGESLTLVAKVE